MIALCIKSENENYGSALQSYAFLSFFAVQKANFTIINYIKKYHFFDYVKNFPRLLNPILLNDKKEAFCKKRGIYKHPQIKAGIKLRNNKFQGFFSQYFSNVTTTIIGYSELQKASFKYSVAISRSDQLWSPAALGSHFYTLEFCNDSVARFSYASSFGVNYIPWYQKKRTKRFLNKYQEISVREKSGANIIYCLTKRKVEVVLDPVFLINRDGWVSLICKQEKKIEGKYVFAYFLGSDRSYRDKVQNFAKKNDLKIVTLPHLDQYVKADVGFGDYELYDVSPFDFLSLVFNATYVFTDSFHGTSFSIILHKQFMTFYRYREQSRISKNTRVDSILSLTNLESRLFKGNIEEIKDPINFKKVDDMLSPMIEKSKEFLIEAIKNDKNPE